MWRKIGDSFRDHLELCQEGEDCEEKPVFITKLKLKKLTVSIALCEKHAKMYDDFVRQLSKNIENHENNIKESDIERPPGFGYYIQSLEP